MNIRPEVSAAAEKVLPSLSRRFSQIDAVAEENTRRILEAFQAERVSEAYFAGTTGYGYDDIGRDALDRIYARVFGAQAALVRIGFVNGTHALTARSSAALHRERKCYPWPANRTIPCRPSSVYPVMCPAT